MAYPIKKAGIHGSKRFWHYNTIDKRGPTLVLILIILCLLALMIPSYDSSEEETIIEDVLNVSSI
jgi:hypothetical protein